jgi:hypothetical protein
VFSSISRACVPESQWVHLPCARLQYATVIGGRYGQAWGAASPTYISVFRGLQAHFRRHGIELDWVLYADYDALV